MATTIATFAGSEYTWSMGGYCTGEDGNKISILVKKRIKFREKSHIFCERGLYAVKRESYIPLYSVKKEHWIPWTERCIPRENLIFRGDKKATFLYSERRALSSVKGTLNSVKKAIYSVQPPDILSREVVKRWISS